MPPIASLSNQGLLQTQPPGSLQQGLRRLPVQLTGRFAKQAAQGPVAVRGFFENNSLTLNVQTRNAQATLLFTPNAVQNAVARNPAGAVSRAASLGTAIRSATPAVAGQVLGELEVNVLADRIQIQGSRVQQPAAPAASQVAAQTAAPAPQVPAPAALAALAQTQPPTQILNLFGNQPAAPAAAAPRDLSPLVQTAQNARNAPQILKLFEDNPSPARSSPAPALPDLSILAQAAQVNQAGQARILTLFNEEPSAGPPAPAQNPSGLPQPNVAALLGPLVATAIIQNANTQQTPNAPAPQQPAAPAPAPAAGNGTQPQLTGAELGVLFAIFGVVASNTSSPSIRNYTPETARNGTTYEGGVGVNYSVNAEQTLYQNGNTTVTASGGVTAQVSAEGGVTITDNSVQAAGRIGAMVEATASVTAKTQFSENVSTEASVTGTVTAGASAEGSANAALSRDQVAAGAEGGFTAGVFTTVEATQSTDFGKSNVTTTGGLSAGAGVSADASGNFSLTKDELSFGGSFDLKVFAGGSGEVQITVNKEQVEQGVSTLVNTLNPMNLGKYTLNKNSKS